MKEISTFLNIILFFQIFIIYLQKLVNYDERRKKGI